MPAPTLRPAPPPAVAAAPPTARTAAADARRAPAPAPLPAKRVGAAPTAAPATAEPRVHSQAELPEEIRRDLPKLVIGGSSYSGDAASRMVMINGQVFHEGDRLAPDLVLERIRLKSAVLAFKGWRYEVLF
jgi:general secretion pathway protein B